MNKERVLKEAQKIASNFSFWMVSGNITHLYGYAYETPEIKYELEIKFDETFPNTPPQFVYRDAIKKLLGNFKLDKLLIWTPDSSVVDIVNELKVKIQETLNKPFDNSEQQFEPDTAAIENLISEDSESKQTLQDQIRLSQSDEYITPDLNAYPEDPNFEEYIHQPDIINESVTPILQDPQSDFQEDKQKEA